MRSSTRSRRKLGFQNAGIKRRLVRLRWSDRSGKGLVGKGGVVRDPKLHEAVINDITKWIEFEIKMDVLGVIESPILGPSGNKEFLMVATKF